MENLEKSTPAAALDGDAKRAPFNVNPMRLLAVLGAGALALAALSYNLQKTADTCASETWRVQLHAASTEGPWTWTATQHAGPTGRVGRTINGPLHPGQVFPFTLRAAQTEARQALDPDGVPAACVIG